MASLWSTSVQVLRTAERRGGCGLCAQCLPSWQNRLCSFLSVLWVSLYQFFFFLLVFKSLNSFFFLRFESRDLCESPWFGGFEGRLCTLGNTVFTGVLPRVPCKHLACPRCPDDVPQEGQGAVGWGESGDGQAL